MTANILANTLLLARTAKDSTSFDPSMLYLILALVSLFLLVLFLVFLRNRMIPLFKLWYVSARYGKYSFEFLEFFKENNLRNPHNNCIKDEITLRFLVFFKPARDAVNYKTNNLIEFGETPFLTTYKQLMKTKGIPDCINVAKFADSRVKVIGYNETLQGMKMKSLFYFIDEKFVMGEFVFSDLIKVKPAKITGILSTKYLDGRELTSDSIYFADPKTTILYYENNGFSICMRYFFAGDTQINETLASVYATGGDSAENYIRALHNEEMLNRF